MGTATTTDTTTAITTTRGTGVLSPCGVKADEIWGESENFLRSCLWAAF